LLAVWRTTDQTGKKSPRSADGTGAPAVLNGPGGADCPATAGACTMPAASAVDQKSGSVANIGLEIKEKPP